MRNIGVSMCAARASVISEDLASAFCITVYNESLSSLKRTLASVVEGIVRHGVAESNRMESCLCIIVDGGDAANPELLDWLHRSKFVHDGPVVEMAGELVHLSAHSTRDIFQILGGGESAAASEHGTIGVMVCVKGRNVGKLHSHFLFFRHICAWIRPTFCLQIDTGTVIESNAYAALLARMEDDPEIGALAPCITTAEPDGLSSFITTWQYFDFVLQKALSWPCEAAAGYLSVMPGQFCIFRWVALQSPSGGEGKRPAPVDGYLRGLTTEDPLERIMYLAEDRVIGNEIVLAEDANWKLKYCPEARAVTDACGTIRELMRQRRRWNNSALACRVWLFGKVPEYLARRDRSLGQKCRFSVAMLMQFIFLLFDFGAPAVVVATLAAFINTFQGEGSDGLNIPKIVFCTGVAALLMLSAATRICKKLDSNKAVALARAILSAISMIAMTIICYSQFSMGTVALLFAPVALGCLAMALLDWRFSPRMLIWHNVFVLSHLVLSPLLATYSIFNLNDVSWGTKGLATASGQAGEAGRLRLRNAVLAVWLTFNLALTFLALGVPGMTSPRLNIVFETTCFVGAVAAAISVAYLSLVRLRARSKVRRSSSVDLWARNEAAAS